MSTRSLVLWPDDRLAAPCRHVDSIGKPELRLFHDLVDTMRAENGIGIAAPQIGVTKMVFVVDATVLEDGGAVGFKPTDGAVAFVNPWVPSQSLTGSWDWEYCLSFPNRTARVWRSSKALVAAQDLHGVEFRVDLSGLAARCALHEYDHLRGKTLFDYGLIAA